MTDWILGENKMSSKVVETNIRWGLGIIAVFAAIVWFNSKKKE